MRPRITDRERRLAGQMARDNARPVRWGVRAATIVGAKLMRDVLEAYRRRDPALIELPAKHLFALAPDVANAMTMSRLLGMERAKKLATLRLSYESAIEVLTRRLRIPYGRLTIMGNHHNRAAVQMLTKAAEAVEFELQKAMFELTKQGAHVREGIDCLRDVFDSLGITPTSSFQMEAIFRTQTQVAYSGGLWGEMQDPDIDEILWGYKYVTVGDDRVRDEHAILEGTTAPKNDPIWDTIWPPNGWACRCAVIPLFEERAVYRPEPVVEKSGRVVRPGPDKGFDYHPGKVFATAI